MTTTTTTTTTTIQKIALLTFKPLHPLHVTMSSSELEGRGSGMDDCAGRRESLCDAKTRASPRANRPSHRRRKGTNMEVNEKEESGKNDTTRNEYAPKDSALHSSLFHLSCL